MGALTVRTRVTDSLVVFHGHALGCAHRARRSGIASEFGWIKVVVVSRCMPIHEAGSSLYTFVKATPSILLVGR
jgi:hypothetical protein